MHGTSRLRTLVLVLRHCAFLSSRILVKLPSTHDPLAMVARQAKRHGWSRMHTVRSSSNAMDLLGGGRSASVCTFRPPSSVHTLRTQGRKRPREVSEPSVMTLRSACCRTLRPLPADPDRAPDVGRVVDGYSIDPRQVSNRIKRKAKVSKRLWKTTRRQACTFDSQRAHGRKGRRMAISPSTKIFRNP